MHLDAGYDMKITDETVRPLVGPHHTMLGVYYDPFAGRRKSGRVARLRGCIILSVGWTEGIGRGLGGAWRRWRGWISLWCVDFGVVGMRFDLVVSDDKFNSRHMHTTHPISRPAQISR
jgi:hypothetical protein